MNERKNTHHNHDHNDEMTEFETLLSDRIHNSVIDLPPAKGPDAAADRAHTRTRHRRGVLAGAAALALVAGVVGQNVADDDSDAGLDTAGTMNVDNNGVNLDWQVTDDGLSMVSSYSGTGAGLYALSTAPGTRYEDYPNANAPRAMYRLADDGTWTPIELGDNDPAVSRVSERRGSLYALSTAADTGQPVGSVSTDGGDTWTPVPLAAIDPPSDNHSWGMNYSLDLASTNDVTFGLVTANFYFPAEEVFPDQFGNNRANEEGAAEEYGWELTDEGVDLIRYSWEGDASDPDSSGSTVALPDATGLSEEERAAIESGAAGETEGEVVETVPWSELGLTSRADLAPRTTAYVVDGETWTEVDSPLDPSGDGWSVLSSSGDSLLLSQIEFNDSGEGTNSVVHSVDGITWSPVTTPGPGTTVVTSAGLLHNYEGRNGPNTISVSTDHGGTWQELDLSTIDPRIEELDVSYHQAFGGPLGAAVIINEESDDGSGAAYLAYSSDLTSWTVTDLRELSPESNWFDGVLVGTDRLVVQGVGDPNGEDEPQDTQTLVAVPTR